MTGFLRRIGHQITQCAPVSAFAWVAGQGGSPAGAAVHDVAGSGPLDSGLLAARATPATPTGGDVCPPPAQVLSARQAE
ncbi:MAG: hypothetical protein GEV08_22805, partial [Acidimicrobiia bacterium]|nr:hypothetical protein [Acidimicrobiia bacterium]